MTERHLYTNRLIHQKSPYLQQHAHNPVDWYPWGSEAFAAARDSDKPIFLSIGYATCHWCHVMEKESFENPDVAKQMNETFINIKVDREELPEVDGLYMEFAQSMMAGSAGWPLNVIITPELQPFFAATYLPPHTHHGLMGLMELIQRIKEVWEGEEREKVIMQSARIVEVFAENIHIRGDTIPEKEQIEDTAEILFRLGDPIYGGMKGVPKFPIAYQTNFLIQYSFTFKEGRALFLAEKTLDMMQRGGIYDHLGGGFSRYSVDEQWLVPHFEKMLYDNALLIHSYLEAWQCTKKPFYKQICEEIIQYILRDMTDKQGGFYSAEDADSEGHEGFFYTWTFQEISNILGKENAPLFCNFYDVTQEGNFEGRNILHTKLRIEEFASVLGVESKDLADRLASLKNILYKTREQRVHPFKDDKILSSWNGLMIFSLAQAGCAFNRQEYIQAALKAARFIQAKMWKQGKLLRRWRDGEALYPAGLDEYAFLLRGYLSLFEAGCGDEWLAIAMEIASILKEHFKSQDGAFYQTDGSDPSIILRKCQYSDGAEPSGNAIHCENLLRLYQLTADPDYLEQAEDILRAIKKYVDNYSPGYCYHMINLNRFYDRSAPTIVVALNEAEERKQDLMQLLYESFLPHKAIIWRKTKADKLFELIPFIKNQEPVGGMTTLYICFEGRCDKPITDYAEMVQRIEHLG